MDCREKILSNNYVDYIADLSIAGNVALQNPESFCYQILNDDVGILHFQQNLIWKLSDAQYDYLYNPKCYGLMDNAEMNGAQIVRFDPTTLVNSGILSVQGEPLQLTGKGVVIGFIDTGIQYDNPVFMNRQGLTRILAIWDQTIQDGNPPEGEYIGTEYLREDIQVAIDSRNPLEIVPSTDTNGHGTRMASVAAGSKLQGGAQFIGAAPDCDIVVVKLKEAKEYLRRYYVIPDGVPCYQSNDIMLGIKYLQKFVQVLKRPLVICIGVGTSLGSHKGTDFLSGYIDSTSIKKNRAIIIAGGNEGNAGHHFSGLVKNEETGTPVEVQVSDNVEGFSMDIWGEIPYSYSITIKSPGGEIIPRIFTREKGLLEYGFVFEKTTIQVNYVTVEHNSGNNYIGLRFLRPTAGIWTVTVFSEGPVQNGRFEMWLPIRAFLTNKVIFLKSNPYTTLTVPAYTRRGINVSTYNDRNGSFFIESGRGFASNGDKTPDIAAPGVNVSTIEGDYSGSSLAAAITAGGAAQLFQWGVVEENDLLMSAVNIKNYLIRGAVRDANMTYPNQEWGFGKLNIAGVFEWLAHKK